MEIKDYNNSGVYPHEVNGHVVNIKWSARKEVDDWREKPYMYEAVASVGRGKKATTIRIAEANPKEAHQKIEEKINRFFGKQDT